MQTRCRTPISTPMRSSTDRRAFLTGAAAIAIAVAGLAPGRARAQTGDQASALVNQLVNEITGIINSGRSESQMLGEFERVFLRYADVAIIGQTTLGVDWRRASQSQRRAYIDSFTGYIARKYGKRFREFIGGEVVVTGVRQVKSFQEVTSIARLRGQNPFQVNWLISDKSGSPKFFNLFVDGINMLASERAEIGTMLDRRGGNIDALIADLRTLG
jgi:phospholipid transport system substrate-binding protein